MNYVFPTVTNQVVNNLIENQYLHSNTDNFKMIARSSIFSVRQGGDGHINADFEKLRNRLVELIYMGMIKVNNFYIDMGLTKIDSFIYDAKQNICEYKSDGAREFSLKYLQSTKQNPSNIQNLSGKILEVINSPASVQAIKNYYTISVNTVRNQAVSTSMFDTNAQNFFNKLSDLITNKYAVKMSQNISEITLGNIYDALTKMFVENRRSRGIGIHFKSTIKKKKKNYKNSIEEFNKLLNSIGIEMGSVYESKQLQTLRNTLLQKYFNVFVFDKMGALYWDNFLTPQLLKLGAKIDGRKRVRFINMFSKILQGYPSLNFLQGKDFNKGLTGFVLELGMEISLNLPLNAGKEIATIIGQSPDTRKYINEILNDDERISTTSTRTGLQSASDLIIKGKSGTQYYFQLKNSFLEDKKALSFRTQAEIKLSTFIGTAMNGFDEGYKNMLTYLLINAGYLKDKGLNSKGGENPFSFSNEESIRDYLLVFLQQTYLFLLGTEYEKNVSQETANLKGNIAYIYQGKYFIPIATFFFSALQMLNNFISKDNQILSGVGGVHTPTFKNIPDIQNQNYRYAKLETLRTATYKNPVTQKNILKYPPELVSIGSSVGQEVYNKMSLGSISMTLIIDNLERLFRR